MGLVRAVAGQGGFGAVGLVTVGHPDRDADQVVVILAEEVLLDHALGRGAFTQVAKDQLDHALYHAVMLGLFAVDMPTLDRARHRLREVDLAELGEDRAVTTEHVHDHAALVTDLAQWLNVDSFDLGALGKFADVGHGSVFLGELFEVMGEGTVCHLALQGDQASVATSLEL